MSQKMRHTSSTFMMEGMAPTKAFTTTWKEEQEQKKHCNFLIAICLVGDTHTETWKCTFISPVYGSGWLAQVLPYDVVHNNQKCKLTKVLFYSVNLRPILLSSQSEEVYASFRMTKVNPKAKNTSACSYSSFNPFSVKWKMDCTYMLLMKHNYNCLTFLYQLFIELIQFLHVLGHIIYLHCNKMKLILCQEVQLFNLGLENALIAEKYLNMHSFKQ